MNPDLTQKVQTIVSIAYQAPSLALICQTKGTQIQIYEPQQKSLRQHLICVKTVWLHTYSVSLQASTPQACQNTVSQHLQCVKRQCFQHLQCVKRRCFQYLAFLSCVTWHLVVTLYWTSIVIIFLLKALWTEFTLRLN